MTEVQDKEFSMCKRYYMRNSILAELPSTANTPQMWFETTEFRRPYSCPEGYLQNQKGTMPQKGTQSWGLVGFLVQVSSCLQRKTNMASTQEQLPQTLKKSSAKLLRLVNVRGWFKIILLLSWTSNLTFETHWKHCQDHNLQTLTITMLSISILHQNTTVFLTWIDQQSTQANMLLAEFQGKMRSK